MCVVKMTFEFTGEDEDYAAHSAIQELLATLRFNGQILGREHAVYRDENGYAVVLMTTAKNALSPRNNSHYNKFCLKRLRDQDVGKPEVRILDESELHTFVCTCRKKESYILEGDYSSLDSPLRCGKCYCPVPLYRIRDESERRIHDLIIPWMSDFNSLDRLFMNDATGYRYAYRELSKADSSLSKRGRKICQTIEKVTNVPTYYYLYRHHGRTIKSEAARKCPGCKRNWHLDQPWHDRFEFRCDKCRLVSHYALDCYND